ncbi:MAG: hypothetical protein AAF938_10910 [Myxococcota bacterium]
MAAVGAFAFAGFGCFTSTTLPSDSDGDRRDASSTFRDGQIEDSAPRGALDRSTVDAAAEASTGACVCETDSECIAPFECTSGRCVNGRCYDELSCPGDSFCGLAGQCFPLEARDLGINVRTDYRPGEDFDAFVVLRNERLLQAVSAVEAREDFTYSLGSIRWPFDELGQPLTVELTRGCRVVASRTTQVRVRESGSVVSVTITRP